MIRKLALAAAVVGFVATGCAGEQKAFRTNEELAQRTLAAPAASVPARLTRDVEVRASPHELSPVTHRLSSGTEVLTTEQASRGWRRVKTQDGVSGYVQDAAVEVTGAAAAAPAAQ